MTLRSSSNRAASSLALAILLTLVMPCLAETTLAHGDPRHICGSRWAAQERAAGRVASMPMRQRGGAARVASIAQDLIAVGTQLEFPVFGVVGTVSATCRYVGDKVFVTCWTGYAEDDQNASGKLEDLKRNLICVDRKTGNALAKG